MEHIFDSHAHYDDAGFDEDRDVLLHRLLDEHHVTGIVNASCDRKSIETSKALAARYPGIWFAAGIHPESADEWNAEAEDQLLEAVKAPKCVAVGEIGLDYHFDDNPPRELQQTVFARQLEIAGEYHLPVIIHSRDACEDTLKLLKQYRPQGVMHCFSYSPEIAREICSLGLYVGFNGVVTFKNARKPKESAKAVPADRLLIETDCPYMAPEPCRGSRCDSSLLPHTAAVLADLRGVSCEELAMTTEANARRLFAIR